MTSGGSSGPGAPAPAPPRPPLALIASVTVNAVMANVLITPVAPDIAADFGAGPRGVGLIIAAATAPGILVAPVVGALSDRLGRRAVLVPCLVLFGAAGLLGGVAPSFAVLVALRVTQGIGGAGLLNLAVTLIADHWEGEERARAIGRNLAVLTVGIALLPPVGGLLASLGGWRLTFTPYAAALVTAVAVARRLPPQASSGVGGMAAQARQLLPHVGAAPVPTVLVMAFMLFLLLFGLCLTALPVHLDQRFGLGAGGRGLVLGVPAVTSAAAALSLGRIRGAVGTTVAVVAAWVVIAASFLSLSLAGSVTIVVAASLGYGLGEGVLIPLLQDRVSEAAPPAVRGAVLAIFVSVTRVAQTAGPLLAGAAAEPIGAPRLFAAGAVLAVATAVVPSVLRRGRILALD